MQQDIRERVNFRHRANLDLNTELEVTIRVNDEKPILGINGYYNADYLLPFFDCDNPDIMIEFRRVMRDLGYPFIVTETTKGYHFVGFTPVNRGYYFKLLSDFMLIGYTDRKFVGYTLVRGYPTLRIGVKDGNPVTFRDIYIPRNCKHSVVTDHVKIYPMPDKARLLLQALPQLKYFGNVPVMEMYR